MTEHDEHPDNAAAGHWPFLAHHFHSPRQQYEAGKLGMWIFLLTEILLFGGLFCAYAVYRANRPEIFAWAHQFLDKRLGAINTAVLITSSLTMAWAVHCAQTNRRRRSAVFLALTLLCACAFLAVKCVEYKHKWEDGLLWVRQFRPVETTRPARDGLPAVEHAPAEQPQPRDAGIFFSIYFAMTGLHALHVLAGMAAIGWVLARTLRGHFSSVYFGPVDYVGLYWHLVDLIWIYLFPLLYLIH
jgi:cytochrome c oxidase subunit 3